MAKSSAPEVIPEAPEEAPPASVNENELVSESSESESENESMPLPQPESNETPISSPLPEVPVNNEPAVAGSPAASTETINGGRSHYVHATNKKASTHRHHKRRNRHQTLRNYKK